MQDNHSSANAIILTDRGQSCISLPSTVGLVKEGVTHFYGIVVHLCASAALIHVTTLPLNNMHVNMK